jgi:hypothetical protein
MNAAPEESVEKKAFGCLLQPDLGEINDRLLRLVSGVIGHKQQVLVEG